MPLDLTRSLLIVLIPGAVALAPWLLCLVYGSPDALNYVEKYTTFVHGVIFAAAAIVGLTCETIGTWIEVRWDTEREAKYNVEENWFAYLARPIAPEPVGYRYLSRRATAFYFELTMFVACLPFAGGIGVLASLTWPSLAVSLLITLTAALFAALWFRTNARTTHAFLCSTRAELNRRLTLAKS